MLSNRTMEAGQYLLYGLMARRFTKLIEKKKKGLEEDDIEFLFRIIEFFEGAKNCRKSVDEFTYTALENYDRYDFCLRFMPKLFKIEKTDQVISLIEEFILDIKNTMDMNEIIPKGLERESKFFHEIIRYCISKHSELTMGCW